MPCVTGFGLPVFTMAISALLAPATTTVALAVLVVMPVGILPAVAVAVSVMFVPAGVAAATCRTRLKVAAPFTASVPARVQVIVPVPPTSGTVPQVHPAGGVIDRKFVFGGVVCVKVIPAFVTAGPLFVTTCVYVTLLPAATDVADGELVVIRSAWVAVATTSAAVALLLVRFGSVTGEVTFAVSLIAVPEVVPTFTFTIYVMVAGAPEARLGLVQTSVARVQAHPAGPVSDTEVVFAGSASVRVTDAAALGPLLVTTCV